MIAGLIAVFLPYDITGRGGEGIPMGLTGPTLGMAFYLAAISPASRTDERVAVKIGTSCPFLR